MKNLSPKEMLMMLSEKGLLPNAASGGACKHWFRAAEIRKLENGIYDLMSVNCDPIMITDGKRLLSTIMNSSARLKIELFH
jgi:hypothetical protein